MTPKIEPTQADRDAAADYLEAIVPTWPKLAERVRSGQTAMSRAFARHAQAARAEGYEQAIREAAEFANSKTANAKDWDSSYWDQACFQCSMSILKLLENDE